MKSVATYLDKMNIILILLNTILICASQQIDQPTPEKELDNSDPVDPKGSFVYDDDWKPIKIPGDDSSIKPIWPTGGTTSKPKIKPVYKPILKPSEKPDTIWKPVLKPDTNWTESETATQPETTTKPETTTQPETTTTPEMTTKRQHKQTRAPRPVPTTRHEPETQSTYPTESELESEEHPEQNPNWKPQPGWPPQNTPGSKPDPTPVWEYKPKRHCKNFPKINSVDYTPSVKVPVVYNDLKLECTQESNIKELVMSKSDELNVTCNGAVVQRGLSSYKKHARSDTRQPRRLDKLILRNYTQIQLYNDGNMVLQECGTVTGGRCAGDTLWGIGIFAANEQNGCLSTGISGAFALLRQIDIIGKCASRCTLGYNVIKYDKLISNRGAVSRLEDDLDDDEPDEEEEETEEIEADEEPLQNNLDHN